MPSRLALEMVSIWQVFDTETRGIYPTMMLGCWIRDAIPHNMMNTRWQTCLSYVWQTSLNERLIYWLSIDQSVTCYSVRTLGT